MTKGLAGLALASAILATIAGCDRQAYRVRLFSGDKMIGEWRTEMYVTTDKLVSFRDVETGQMIAVGGNVIIDQYDRVITPEKP